MLPTKPLRWLPQNTAFLNILDAVCCLRFSHLILSISNSTATSGRVCFGNCHNVVVLGSVSSKPLRHVYSYVLITNWIPDLLEILVSPKTNGVSQRGASSSARSWHLCPCRQTMGHASFRYVNIWTHIRRSSLLAIMKPMGNTLFLSPGVRTDATYNVPLNSLQRWVASRKITGLKLKSIFHKSTKGVNALNLKGGQTCEPNQHWPWLCSFKLLNAISKQLNALAVQPFGYQPWWCLGWRHAILCWTKRLGNCFLFAIVLTMWFPSIPLRVVHNELQHGLSSSS